MKGTEGRPLHNWAMEPLPVFGRLRVGTLLVTVVVGAALWGVLQWLGADKVVLAAAMSFFIAVALGRVLLFKGRRPLAASTLAGSSIGAICLVTVYACILCNVSHRDEYFITLGKLWEHRDAFPAVWWYAFITWVVRPLLAILMGGVSGCLEGLLIGSVSLLVERASKMTKEPLSTSSGLELLRGLLLLGALLLWAATLCLPVSGQPLEVLGGRYYHSPEAIYLVEIDFPICPGLWLSYSLIPLSYVIARTNHNWAGTAARVTGLLSIPGPFYLYASGGNGTGTLCWILSAVLISAAWIVPRSAPRGPSDPEGPVDVLAPDNTADNE